MKGEANFSTLESSEAPVVDTLKSAFLPDCVPRRNLTNRIGSLSRPMTLLFRNNRLIDDYSFYDCSVFALNVAQAISRLHGV